MKEKLYIYALIVVLMLSLIGIQSIFIDNIENRAIVNNNIDGFVEYRVDNINSSIRIPEKWEVIIYKDKSNMLGFNNKDNNINGNLEIIESNNTVAQEIDAIEDKKNTSILNKSWYVVQIENNSGTTYYYIREYSEGKLLKLTFNIEDNNYKPSLEVVFDKIAESFK